MCRERELKEISFDSFSKFLEKRINDLKLGNFIIGGISMGFFIVNKLPFDHRCQGILAIEPYIDSNTLLFGRHTVKVLIILISGIQLLKLERHLWESNLFKVILSRLKLPKNIIPSILAEYSPQTFFKLAKIILSNNEAIKFQNKPYVLLVNKDDGTVSYNYLVKVFKEKVNQLKIITTHVEHYPSDLSKQYFEMMIPNSQVIEVINFLFTTGPLVSTR